MPLDTRQSLACSLICTSILATVLVGAAPVSLLLSWILRPYLGKPTLPVQFLRDGALQGSFLEEVGRWLGL